MERETVKSSNLASIGYDEENKYRKDYKLF
jgi:hypothetical protein